MNIYNRTILIGIINKKQNKKKCLNNLEELEKLIITLKGKVIKKFYQRIRKINLKTYIGKGKIKTIKKFIIKKKIKTIIFNDKISSIQYRNIENFINKNNIFIYDRTKIILDIFKYRSKNYNSKIQIELAEKKYLFTRLNKM
ncbi:MAG: hypothetical protein ABUS76_00830 [Candidatus Shikimatogenerans sp. Ttur]|uniref:GTPase HflX N-terminal domain-containing protein n=1 Tax=Candidatus Shikimatogenerans sp. Ttur TaxID=3158569 RepID=A0AAU7ZXE9_9FLAO